MVITPQHAKHSNIAHSGRLSALVAPCLKLAAGLLFCLAATNGHAELVGRWVADDWAGGTNNWVDRVAGRIATVPASANSPTKTPGVFPPSGSNATTGLVFDGVDDYLSVDAGQNPIVGKTSVTIMAFFLTTQGAPGVDDHRFWSYPGPLNGESPFMPNDWGLTYDTAGNAQGFFNETITVTPSVSLINGRPHTMILTWQDPSVFPGEGLARLYVDGVLVGSTTRPQDGGGGIVDAGFVIGANAIALDRFFSGAIGELRFYDSIEFAVAGLVTSADDGGAGSLRQVIASAPTGSTITFDPALSGQTIALTNGQILMDRSLTVDASALPAGITISGNNASRVFEVASGATVLLDSLTITGGKSADGAVGAIGSDGGDTQPGGPGGPGSGGAPGGGIFNQGTLTLNRVTLSGNTTGKGGKGGDGGPGLLQGAGGNGGGGGVGGAIYNSGTGTLTILNSTIVNNTDGAGGNGGGSDTRRGSGGNGGSGGGIANAGILNLTQTTITGNAGAVGGNGETGSAFGGSGGGVFNTGTLNLTNSIVALNSAPDGQPDLSGSATAVGGVNFVGDPTGVNGLGTAGVDYLTGDPLLAPLGSYGGPAQTRPPLPGSPAINATSGGLGTDQRGLTRPQGAGFDIGAVEMEFATVTNAADSGPGSLRQRIFEAGNYSGILIDAGLAGKPLVLTGGQITFDKSLTLNASAVAGGLTVSGNNLSRVFAVAAGQTVDLRSLTITDGNATAGQGGGIFNSGNLTLDQCTLSENSASGAGGGLYVSSGAVTLNNSTVSGNMAGGTGNGGGISNPGGTLTLNQCTLTGNSTPANGGGVAFGANGGTLVMNQCTVTENVAAIQGGGIFNNGVAFTVFNSIVAGNTAPTATEISGAGTFTGVNLTNGPPQLSPLGNYGGPTLTMPPLPGSPAIDGCTNGTSFITDQRGISRQTGWTNDFSSDLGGAAVLTGGGSVNPATGTLDAGSFLLTPEVNYQETSLVLPDLGPFSTFSATFDLYYSDGSGYRPADGFSFSFGPAPGNAVGEAGIAGGHVVSFDSFEYHPYTNGIIRYLRTTDSPTSITSTTTFDVANSANLWHRLTVTLKPGGLLTVLADGVPFLEDIDTGYTYAPGDRFTFGARTGGFNSEQRVDNIGILFGNAGLLPDIGAVEGAFVPAGTTRLVGPTFPGNGSVQLTFTSTSGAIFTVLGTNDLSLPLNMWSNLGYALEMPPGSGQFHFSEPQAANEPQRFYTVLSP